jgi:hypothetical protein
MNSLGEDHDEEAEGVGAADLNVKERSMFPAENLRDWRGEEIRDESGDKVGEMEAVYVDTRNDEPAFATVKTGMVGRHKLVFVPLEGAVVGPGWVKVQRSKKVIKDAPWIDTDGELPASEEETVFSYYEMPYETGKNGERRLGRR